MGLYILGRRTVFESCFELREAFQLLFQRPDKLSLVTGEMFPAARRVDDVAEDRTAVMEGVEHLGQYVYEMTKAKVEALKAGGGVLPPPAQMKLDGEGVGAEEEEDEDVDDDDGGAGGEGHAYVQGDEAAAAAVNVEE